MTQFFIAVPSFFTTGQGQQQAPQHQPINEIRQYLDGRYVSASEAMWRIFGFPLHSGAPPVVRLQVHLENQQQVTFNIDGSIPAVASMPPPKTTLTEFFALCERDPAARSYTYQNVVKGYVWNHAKKVWTPRLRSPHGLPIGRIYSCHPGQGERYYLRLLLCHVRGPRSFRDLRTVNGHECSTFKEAAVERGLVADNGEWHRAFSEGATFQMPVSLRVMFCCMLLQSAPASDAWQLWQTHQDALCEDKLLAARDASHNPTLPLAQSMIDEALRDVQQAVVAAGAHYSWPFLWCFICNAATCCVFK